MCAVVYPKMRALASSKLIFYQAKHSEQMYPTLVHAAACHLRLLLDDLCLRQSVASEGHITNYYV